VIEFRVGVKGGKIAVVVPLRRRLDGETTQNVVMLSPFFRCFSIYPNFCVNPIHSLAEVVNTLVFFVLSYISTQSSKEVSDCARTHLEFS
jgi:hypothetical protein